MVKSWQENGHRTEWHIFKCLSIWLLRHSKTSVGNATVVCSGRCSSQTKMWLSIWQWSAIPTLGWHQSIKNYSAILKNLPNISIGGFNLNRPYIFVNPAWTDKTNLQKEHLSIRLLSLLSSDQYDFYHVDTDPASDTSSIQDNPVKLNQHPLQMHLMNALPALNDL